MKRLRSSFWAVIFILSVMPRLLKLSGRLVLWGARSGEETDRMLETSLFKKEWDSIKAEMDIYFERRMGQVRLHPAEKP